MQDVEAIVEHNYFVWIQCVRFACTCVKKETMEYSIKDYVFFFKDQSKTKN